MVDGFRGGSGGGPQDMGHYTLEPGVHSLGDYRNFNSVVLSMLYTGNPVFPAAGDFMQVQTLWRDPFDNLLFVDEFELNSTYNPDFAGKRQVAQVPVRGQLLAVAVFGGSGGVDGTLDLRVLGSPTVVPRPVFHSDQASYRVTDNIVLAKGGALLAAGAVTQLWFGGLCSGPVTITAEAVMGASTLMLFRFRYGTSLVGPPDLVLTGAGAQSRMQTVYIPRRPITAFVNNVSGGDSGAFSFNIIRDEP